MIRLMLLMTFLLISTARSEDKPCRRLDSGEVACTDVAFKKLTDHLLDLKATVAQQQLALENVNADKADMEKVATACQKALADVPPPPSRKRLAFGYGLGVLSSVALTVSPIPSATDLRVGLAAAGLAGLISGYLLTTHY